MCLSDGLAKSKIEEPESAVRDVGTLTLCSRIVVICRLLCKFSFYSKNPSFEIVLLVATVQNWRLHAAQSRLGVVIAEFADLYGEHDEEGRFQRQPYDVSGWPWKLPADLELRRWDDVLWLYRRLRKGMDSITNYIPKGLLVSSLNGDGESGSTAQNAF